MSRDADPRYYRVRRGRAFWEPGKFAARFGLPKLQKLGPDSAEAKAEALRWNERLDAARKAAREGASKPSRYNKGTLGAFYDWFRATEAWAQMAPRTREDYERAWPHIEARFANRIVTRISAGDSESFHADIHPALKNQRDPKGAKKLPWNSAHRALKVWRALLNALVAYGLLAPPPPVGRVANPEPPGREAVWIYEEVMALAAAADNAGQHGLAIAILLAWDAMLSPVDAWTLPLSGWRYSAAGGEVDTARAKTGKAVLAAVSDDTAAKVELYIERLRASGADLDPALPLVRQANGRPFPDQSKFGKAFRAAREAAFPGDARQFLDLRRSAMTEARMGGATKDDLGAAAANQIDKSSKLAATYLRAASRNVLAARAQGRKPMADKFG